MTCATVRAPTRSGLTRPFLIWQITIAQNAKASPGADVISATGVPGVGMKTADPRMVAAKASEVPSGIEVTVM